MPHGVQSAVEDVVTADDRAFMDRFERCEITEAEWTHLAHVRVAWIALMSDAPDAAVERIRRGILSHNTHVLGRPHKYHETVTVAFARLILDRLDRAEPWSGFARRIDDLLAADEPVLLRYYSPGRLASDEARSRFLEPDLEPLPTAT